ncbi:MAG: hypothetical protein IPM56_17850 [Ignavibacteriales bacterium]|nr:MAG: hypothetical protein IPM56_17850 [Ignavibacteriales bacterium]
MYRIINSTLTVFLLSLFIYTSAFAGGFHISVKKSNGENSAYAKNVMLVVQPFGCHQPTDAEVSGTAEGIVNGTRKTIDLKFVRNDKGESTLTKQWPDEGVWVIAINASYNNAKSSALVEIGTDYNLVRAKDDDGIKTFHKKLDKAEVESSLKKHIASLKKV